MRTEYELHDSVVHVVDSAVQRHCATNAGQHYQSYPGTIYCLTALSESDHTGQQI